MSDKTLATITVLVYFLVVAGISFASKVPDQWERIAGSTTLASFFLGFAFVVAGMVISTRQLAVLAICQFIVVTLSGVIAYGFVVNFNLGDTSSLVFSSILKAVVPFTISGGIIHVYLRYVDRKGHNRQ